MENLPYLDPRHQKTQLLPMTTAASNFILTNLMDWNKSSTSLGSPVSSSSSSSSHVLTPSMAQSWLEMGGPSPDDYVDPVAMAMRSHPVFHADGLLPSTTTTLLPCSETLSSNKRRTVASLRRAIMMSQTPLSSTTLLAPRYNNDSYSPTTTKPHYQEAWMEDVVGPPPTAPPTSPSSPEPPSTTCGPGQQSHHGTIFRPHCGQIRPSSVTISHSRRRASWMRSTQKNTHLGNSKDPSGTYNDNDNDDNDSDDDSPIRPTSSSIINIMADQWRTAVDPNSGRTYYYHLETRVSQWRKPMELASDAERYAMEQKERQQKEFFAAMEQNILQSISEGAFASPPNTPPPSLDDEHKRKTTNVEESSDSLLEEPPEHPLRRTTTTTGSTNTLKKPGRAIRTISSMDESLLRDLVTSVPSHRDVLLLDGGGGGDPSPTNVTDPRLLAGGQQQRRPSSSSKLMVSTTSLRSIVEDNVLEDSPTNQMQNMSLQANVVTTAADVAAPSSGRSLGSSSSSSSSSGSSTRSWSIMSLIRRPSDNSKNNTSSTGNMLEDSAMSFGFNMDEANALEKLAAITDEMTMVQDDDDLSGLSILDKEDSSRELPDKTHEPKRGMPLPLAATKIARPAVGSHTRRNTCGTLYVGSTMADPDKDATIQCICGVYRAHILQSERESIVYNSDNDEFRIFNDWDTQQKVSNNRRGRAVAQKTRFKPQVPTLEDVASFYRDVFRRARMETDCIIMSLIYVERLIKTSNGALRPRAENWRSMLFSCMVLSSKVWDDLSMWNGDFSQTCPAGVKFALKRVNELEVAILSVLQYNVKVPASEYAKYYFLTRSMLIKSGLVGENFQATTPLDVDGAKRMQLMSSRFQQASTSHVSPAFFNHRSKSVGSMDGAALAKAAMMTPKAGGKAVLEQVLKM